MQQNIFFRNYLKSPTVKRKHGLINKNSETLIIYPHPLQMLAPLQPENSEGPKYFWSTEGF